MKLERLAGPAGLARRPRGGVRAHRDRPRRRHSATPTCSLVPLAGGEPRRLAASPASDSRPRWSRDGRRLAFLSTRDGSAQVWRLDARGGEPRKLTSLATRRRRASSGSTQARLARDGRRLPGLRRRRRLQREARLAAARQGGSIGPRVRRAALPPLGHLARRAAQPPARRCRSTAARALDLTPGGDDAPPFSLGRERTGRVSPDGKEACFSRKDAADEAWSTNADVFVVPTSGGEPKRVGAAAGLRRRLPLQPRRRASSPGARRRAPATSPTAGELVVADRRSGAVRSLTEALDRQVESVRVLARRDGRSTSRPRTTAARRFSRCRSRAAPVAAAAARRGHARRPRGAARRAHARRHARRASRTPRRSCASPRTARGSRA